MRWKGIMKAHPFEEKRLLKWKPPFIVQPKYDGVRCRALPLEKGGFMLLSSEENPIFSVPHINEACEKQLPPLEFDGELYIHGESFEDIISITSRTVNLHEDYHYIEYHIFDVVTDEPQSRRLIRLNSLNLKPPLIKAPCYIAEDLTQIMQSYERIVEDGYEGIIVRNFDALYERKRSTAVMKFKPKRSDTYKILDVVEEVSISGVPKGTLGALILDSGNGQTFSVGSGFTAEERRELWKIKETLIGKNAIVEYQHLTSGKKVPRFPVFVGIENPI